MWKLSNLFHLESFCMKVCLENCAYALAIPNTKYPVWEILKKKM